MQVVVVCSPAQQAELEPADGSVLFVPSLAALAGARPDVLIDLLFEEDPATHQAALQEIEPDVTIIADLQHQAGPLPPRWCRINGWPGFLQAPLSETSGGDGPTRDQVAAALQLVGKTPEWVPDIPGMVSARVVAAIINEAFFTLSEGTASREAIDTAMVLGTAYPIGPFTWAERIGVRRVAALLQRLSEEESRYAPCALLQQAALG